MPSSSSSPTPCGPEGIAGMGAPPSCDDLLLRKRAAQAGGCCLPLGSGGDSSSAGEVILGADLLQAKRCAQMRRARHEQQRAVAAATAAATAAGGEGAGPGASEEDVDAEASQQQQQQQQQWPDGDMLLAAKRMARCRRIAFERERAAAKSVQGLVRHAALVRAEASSAAQNGEQEGISSERATSADEAPTTAAAPPQCPATATDMADQIFRDVDSAAAASAEGGSAEGAGTPSSKQALRRRSLGDSKRMSFGGEALEGSPRRSQLTDVSNAATTPTRHAVR
jgi:hypothetical protein